MFIRARLALCCCLLAALWLAACTNDPAPHPPLARAPGAVQSHAATPPGRTRRPAALNDGSAARGAMIKPQQPAARREPTPGKPPRPAMQLRQLIGLDQDGLSRLLGKPTRLRRETPAEVWQYSSKRCVLHLFLYQNADDGTFEVVHVDAVRRGQKPATRNAGISSKPFQQNCLGRLLQRATAQNKTS